MAWANKLVHGSGPSSAYPSSWLNLKMHDLTKVLPFVVDKDGKSLGGLRRDAVVSFGDELLGDPPSRRCTRCFIQPSLYLSRSRSL